MLRSRCVRRHLQEPRHRDRTARSYDPPSPYHLRFSAGAEKSRPTRSGARHRPRPGRVVCRRRRLGLARKPSSRMIWETVFSDTVQPSSRRSAVILGDP